MTEFTMWSESRQVHIFDSSSHTDDDVADLLDAWSDFEDPLSDHLALTAHAVAIATGVNGKVLMAVEVTDGPPDDDANAFVHVTECSLRADSGQLAVTSSTYEDDEGQAVSVPAGPLRLRISLTKSPFDEGAFSDEDEDDPEKWQRVRLQCWSAAPADPILISGWDMAAGKEVLPGVN